MSNFWTAIIAAGAAILSSILTSYLTHYFERRLRKREHELNWLEERFTPALNFLGKVSAIISNAPNTPKGRKQIVDEIHNIVTGPSTENNAWCIAVLLDPEETGLRDHVLSTMTYARIAEGGKELTEYQVRLQLSLEALAKEFRRERQAIVAGKSLETLINERKTELDRTTHRFVEALNVLRAFVNSEADLDPSLRKLQFSDVRGASLDLAFKIVFDAGGRQKQIRLQELHRECEQRGWLSQPIGDGGVH